MKTVSALAAAADFHQRLEDNKRGLGRGVYSVCSAHPIVLEAAMLQAKDDDSPVIIESTSNQVDQFGGYTGMTPSQFVSYLNGIARSAGFPPERLLLGGDHLGPNVWQAEAAAEAMKKARDLVKAYVQAGYRKIHLDASMFCAGDAGDRRKPMPDTIVAERVVELCRVCEEVLPADTTEDSRPFYIIGTEVPVPGGAREQEAPLNPTAPEDIRETLEVTKKSFLNAGLEAAWERVLAVVAQPGVEFGDNQIFYYNREKAQALSGALEGERLVYEAHSTDYQTEKCLRELVEDHFCILKVGPWLTFAFREALFALAAMERELVRREEQSGLEEILEEVMNAAPNYWEKYYQGSDEERRFKRRFSFSDRSRYYWTNPRLKGAVEILLSNLSARKLPLSLISQYFNDQFMPVSEGLIRARPRDLLIAHVRGVLGVYARACKMQAPGNAGSPCPSAPNMVA
ncbi:MAG: D-tagatose-bisphosphate aldolase, class II, non-catalytic subunit [Treponema sp.]|nr:D-tagatose-bisphosphate aldolase, class II, non-catalytic subunit [Treponema sp.]